MRTMMNTKDIRASLIAAFKALTSVQKGRLLYHEKRGTPIACGATAAEFEIANGG